MLRLLTKPKPSPTATTALIADQSAAPSAKAPPRHHSAAPTAAPPQRSLAPRAQPAPLPVKRQQRQQKGINAGRFLFFHLSTQQPKGCIIHNIQG